MSLQPSVAGWYAWVLRSVHYLRAHRALAAAVILAALVLIVGMQQWGPPGLDFAPFIVLPLLLTVYTLGRRSALVLAVAMPAVELMANSLGGIDSLPITVANFLVRAAVSSLLVLLAAAALEARSQQDEALRLRTLHDAVVTINDAMRNHLQSLMNVCELSEIGKPMTQAQIDRCRRSINAAVGLLDRLGSAAGQSTAQAGSSLTTTHTDPPTGS